MKASGSAIHAALPIRRVRPGCIFDDRRAGVVNIGQGAQLKTKAPTPVLTGWASGSCSTRIPNPAAASPFPSAAKFRNVPRSPSLARRRN
jgi:hypothetical protein